jgi:FkbM family methyltransferase
MKTFIEIGACDFNNTSQLLNNGWKGYFVEPIPYFHNKLQEKLKDNPNAFVFAAAISDYDGIIEMLTLDSVFADQDQGNIPSDKRVPDWMRGISHIKVKEGQAIDNYTSNLIMKNVPEWATTIEVPCMTLDTLVQSNNIQEIDILQVDAEGHEFVIFNNYSWAVKPKFMRVEHKFVDDIALAELFARNGYYCWTEKDDIYAVLR